MRLGSLRDLLERIETTGGINYRDASGEVRGVLNGLYSANLITVSEAVGGWVATLGETGTELLGLLREAGEKPLVPEAVQETRLWRVLESMQRTEAEFAALVELGLLQEDTGKRRGDGDARFYYDTADMDTLAVALRSVEQLKRQLQETREERDKAQTAASEANSYAAAEIDEELQAAIAGKPLPADGNRLVAELVRQRDEVRDALQNRRMLALFCAGEQLAIWAPRPCTTMNCVQWAEYYLLMASDEENPQRRDVVARVKKILEDRRKAGLEGPSAPAPLLRSQASAQGEG